MNMDYKLKPVNSIKLRYSIDPKWVNELYPTNIYNNCNLSKLELTIPNFRKYNTRAKYSDVCNTDVFFQIILNRLEFYKPELRQAVVIDTDIDKYKFLIDKTVYLKNKNVGMNRHSFNPDKGTFDVFISDINSIFGYLDGDETIKGLNNSVVCSLPLGEPFESIKIDGMKSMSNKEFFYRVVNYESPQYGATLDLFQKQLKVEDISKDLESVNNIKVGDYVVHTTDFIYRSNICSVERDKDEIKLFVLYDSIVAKKE
jgi:hypothetical protein